MKKSLIPIYDNKDVVELADKQLEAFWLPGEISVEKDLQDVLTNFTEAEKHAVIQILRIFSIYETHAGDEWWGGRFKQMFDSADYHRMASVFSMMELAVHAVFYNKINELLYINTPEFYTSYSLDPALKSRIDHINAIITASDDIEALGGFCMVEGVVLYSQFAFLKHYQSEGKNKLLNVVRGINYSVRDENLHAKGTAYAFREKTKGYSAEQLQKVRTRLVAVAELIHDHELQIIAGMFSKGKIDGITPKQLDNFVKSRINECFADMGLAKVYEIDYNPIAAWFYKGINDFKFNDFFSGIGNEYHKNWDEQAFKWKGAIPA
jgi:ribonucleotide reductase beta subunit family protein with ferritin-like domain